MNWWNILKNAKVSGKATGTGTPLDSSKIKINLNENNCNNQLKEWANKIKNYNLIMKRRYDESKLFQKHFSISPSKKNVTESMGYRHSPVDELGTQFKNYEKSFAVIQKNTQVSGYSGMHEASVFYYSPVPETVACKAIDMLKKSSSSEERYSNKGYITVDGTTYEIMVVSIYDYTNNEHTLTIGIKGTQITKVRMGIFWGENTDAGDEEYRRTFARKPFGEGGIYEVSGFYDAAIMGFGWWGKLF